MQNISLRYQCQRAHTLEKSLIGVLFYYSTMFSWIIKVFAPCVIKINWCNIWLPNLLFLSTPCLGSQTSVDNAKIKPSRQPVEIKLQNKFSDTVTLFWHCCDTVNLGCVKIKKGCLAAGSVNGSSQCRELLSEPKKTTSGENATHCSAADTQVSFYTNASNACKQIAAGQTNTVVKCLELHCIWTNCS